MLFCHFYYYYHSFLFPSMHAGMPLAGFATFTASNIYAAVKPTGQEPRFTYLLPDLLPVLRPYQQRAVHFMLSRELGKLPPQKPQKPQQPQQPLPAGLGSSTVADGSALTEPQGKGAGLKFSAPNSPTGQRPMDIMYQLSTQEAQQGHSSPQEPALLAPSHRQPRTSRRKGAAPTVCLPIIHTMPIKPASAHDANAQAHSGLLEPEGAGLQGVQVHEGQNGAGQHCAYVPPQQQQHPPQPQQLLHPLWRELRMLTGQALYLNPHTGLMRREVRCAEATLFAQH